MGILITRMGAGFGALLNKEDMKAGSVTSLAVLALSPLLADDVQYSHLIAATSCPDSIAPSLGQSVNQHYHTKLSGLHTIDIVQGCAGGVTALILASQLSELNKSNVLVVTPDAAQKATHTGSEVYDVFKNGFFSCCVSYVDSNKKLVHHQSRQYKDLYKVVTIGLGHDADAIISANKEDILINSRKYLGLKLDNGLAIKLMKEAEAFYLDFISKTGHPDILVLHQVNALIINHLQLVFSKYPVHFINAAKETGNCGCATTGIVLYMLRNELENKKVMICSFGTGGVITAGLWQF